MTKLLIFDHFYLFSPNSTLPFYVLQKLHEKNQNIIPDRI